MYARPSARGSQEKFKAVLAYASRPLGLKFFSRVQVTLTLIKAYPSINPAYTQARARGSR